MEIQKRVIRQIINRCKCVFTTEDFSIKSGMEEILCQVKSNPPFSNVIFTKPEDAFLLVEAISASWFYRKDSIDDLRTRCANYLTQRYYLIISNILQRKQKEYSGCSLKVNQITDKIFEVLTDISQSRKFMQRQYEYWTSALKTEVKTIPQLIETITDELCLIEALKQDNAVAILEFQHKMLSKVEVQARIFNKFWTVNIPLNRSSKDYHLNMDVDEIYTWMINEHPPCKAFHNPKNFNPKKSSLDHWIEITIMDRWINNKKTKTRMRQPGLLFKVLKEHKIINYDKVEHIECWNSIIASTEKNENSKEKCMTKYEGERCYKCKAYFDENRDKRVHKRKYFNPDAYRFEEKSRKKCSQCGNLIILTDKSKHPKCPRDGSPPKEYAKPISIYVYDHFLHLDPSTGISLNKSSEEYRPSFIALVPDRDRAVNELFQEMFEEASTDETIIEVLREEYPEDEQEAIQWESTDEKDWEQEQNSEDVDLKEYRSEEVSDIYSTKNPNIRRAIYLLRKFDSLIDGLSLAIWRYVAYETRSPQRNIEVLWEFDCQQPLSDEELMQVFYWIIEEQRELIEKYSEKQRTSPLSFSDLAQQFRNHKVKIERTMDIELGDALTADNIGLTYRRNIVEKMEEVKNLILNFQQLIDYACQLQDQEKLVWNYLMAERENPNNRDWSIILQVPPENLLDVKDNERMLELFEEKLISLYVWVQWQHRRRQKSRPKRWTTLARHFNENSDKIQKKLDIKTENITANRLEDSFKKIKEFFGQISK